MSEFRKLEFPGLCSLSLIVINKATEAMALFEELQEIGPRPNIRTYNTLINATIFSRQPMNLLASAVFLASGLHVL